jgi:hypothetical protein
MSQPFIRNHQYNLIKKQAGLLRHACSTASDPEVVKAVKYSAEAAIMEAFPDASEAQRETLGKLEAFTTTAEFQQYLHSLEAELAPFGPISEQQIKKLFPKQKKLKVPDLATFDFRRITYLGWQDIASNRLYLIYSLDGKWVGVEGKLVPTNKKGYCFLCNRNTELAMFTVVTRKRPANVSPDYYKAIGNYVCVDSETCNHNITDLSALEKFVRYIIG